MLMLSEQSAFTSPVVLEYLLIIRLHVRDLCGARQRALIPEANPPFVKNLIPSLKQASLIFSALEHLCEILFCSSENEWDILAEPCLKSAS